MSQPVDHRQLGQELDLFFFDELAPASPFFLPKGAAVYQRLIQFIRDIYAKMDYQEVVTPQIFNVNLWKTSGHYQNYKENMFFVSGGISDSEDPELNHGVKPMNCPGHMVMFKHRKWSYRDLPLRYADFGRLHRFESSGSTSGLTRVRSFCQDDSHIFLAISQIEGEIRTLLQLFMGCYQHFGFNDVKLYLSTRPQSRMGEDSVWDAAENALKAALAGHKYTIKEGDGAFYGPKIDIEVADALGRGWQLGTIQLDFLLPEKFDLHFINAANTQERPVVIHRAILGSIERFMAVLLEHTKGFLPYWLAPEQVVVMPIGQTHAAYAAELGKSLSSMARVRVDDRNESVSYRIRDWQLKKIPYIIVVGDKECADGTGSLREANSKITQAVSKDDLVRFLTKLKELESLDIAKLCAKTV